MIAVFHSGRGRVRLPEGHPFPIEKYQMVRQRLLDEGIVERAQLKQSQPVDPRILELVHSRDYLDRVFKGELSGDELRRLGLPWSEGLVLRASAAVGGTIEAAWAALEEGIGANLGGGTHHAFPDRGEAFCIFNDIAVAVRLLQQQKVVKKIAIIDLDVHQGDGTAAIFRYDPGVLILAIYCEDNFPPKKIETDIGVGLPEGTGDEQYLGQLEQHLPRVLKFRPEVIFYQAGVDPLEEDALGQLSLSHLGLKERDRMVLRACKEGGIPAVITLGGGYARPITPTVEAHLNTFRAARELFG
ncbi:MAG: histone deacetylase [Candidatus Bipolaricaulia bacterium]